MLAGGGRVRDPVRPTMASARVVGAADEEPALDGRGRATLIGQLAWDGDHPGLPAGDHKATVALDPRVGGGGTISWTHFRAHGELTGWAYPILSAAGLGGNATVGTELSASAYAGPVELFLAGDAAAGGWYALNLFNTSKQDREVATLAVGVAVHTGPVCLFLDGARSRVAQHGGDPHFAWAQDAWLAGLGARLEADPEAR